MKGTYFRGSGGSGRQVEVVAGGHELHVRGPQLDLRLPLDAAELSLGGTQGRHLVVRAEHGGEAHELYLERRGLAPELEAAGAPPWFVDRVRALAAARRRSWVTTRSLLLAATASVGALLVALLLSLHALAVASVPVAWEEALGEAYVGQLAPQAGPAPEEAELQAFVDELGRRILAARPDQPYSFTFHVVDDATVNAFALPGGEVVVYTGLLEAAESPEEVAGVLAHEVAHVLERHSLRQVVGRLGTFALLALVFGPGEAGLEALLAVELGELRFSRAHEAEADAVGVELLHRAGIDPRGLGRFFDRLARREARAGVPELLSTHPASAERSARVEALAEALPERRYPGVEPEAWDRVKELVGGR